MSYVLTLFPCAVPHQQQRAYTIHIWVIEFVIFALSPASSVSEMKK